MSFAGDGNFVRNLVLDQNLTCENFGVLSKAETSVLRLGGGVSLFCPTNKECPTNICRKLFPKIFPDNDLPPKFCSTESKIYNLFFSVEVVYSVFCTIFTMCSSLAMPILSGRWRCRNTE